MTDAKGRTVNFKNSIIIMTSNAGAEYIDKMESIGFSTAHDMKDDYVQAKEKVTASLKDYFRPEFLNRLDDIIIFDILSEESIKEIVRLQVDIVKDRLAVKEINLDISPAVFSYLAKEGYNPQYGARPLKRLIQNKILTPLASMMISQGVLRGGSVSIGIKENNFTFDVRKGKRGAVKSSEFLDRVAV